jgi:hypothetical protein
MSFHAVGAAGAADALGAALAAVAEESVGAADADGIADAALPVSVGAGEFGTCVGPPHATLAITGNAHTRAKAIRRIDEVFMGSPADPSR